MRDVARTMGCNFLESKNGRATACQGFSSDSAEFLFWSKLARTLARSSSHALLCSPNEQYYYYWSKHGSLLNYFWHFLMSVSQCNWRINQKKAQMMFFLPSLLPSLPFLSFLSSLLLACDLHQNRSRKSWKNSPKSVENHMHSSSSLLLILAQQSLLETHVSKSWIPSRQSSKQRRKNESPRGRGTRRRRTTTPVGT